MKLGGKEFLKNTTMEGSLKPSGLTAALCIDDDKTAHEILTLFLAEQYDIDYAVNGKTALEFANSKNYKLIFLDINLGRDTMDGLELLKLLRKIPAYTKVPIVALTAYAMIGDREEFLRAGCDYYIAKPFNKASLSAVINEIQK